MSSSSDQSTGYFGGLIIGFISLSVFGIASFLLFGVVAVKKPTDRIFEGDFSAKAVAQRGRTLQMVRDEQKKAVNLSKLSEALSKFKPTPPSATSIPFPGSETALKEAAQQSAAPIVEAPKAEAPKAEAPKAEAPKAEAPKAEAPKAEAPKAEAPKAEAPKAEAPKADAPKAEAPKAEAPKAEVSNPKNKPKAESKPNAKDAEPAVE